jgi:serine/threonine protein kinase/predicted Zn-dependent protease
MTPERWQRVDEIFQAAIELKAEERPDFVDSACSGDEELRREVESLISADEQGLSVVDEPAFQAAAGLLVTDEPELSEGQSIGHFEIIGLIGRGGMGEVYLAKDLLLNRRVALKLLPAEYTKNQDRLRRFQQEAQSASALNHPNILTIYELGQVNEQQFIATEFIEGETLRQRLKHAPLTLPETIDIAIQIGSALSTAHNAGIIHRDIKPENIMLRRDGYVKVLDFGLAKLAKQHEPTTQTPVADSVDISSGLMMGTVRYMSPEQAQGHAVDRRSDIFSFGVVLYEMVMGCPPFEGKSDELIAAILKQEPSLANLPEGIRQLIGKALRKKKEERYQTMHEMVLALRSIREVNETKNNHILRRTLGEHFEDEQYTQTEPKPRGSFVADVYELRDNISPEIAKHVHIDVPAEEQWDSEKERANQKEEEFSFSLQSKAPNRSRWLSPSTKRGRILLAVAGALLLLLTGALLWTKLSEPHKVPLAFQQRDWVLIAGFDNRTGEPLFDGTIEGALERELGSSRFVNVVTPERAGDALRLMKKPPETKIDAALGREICLRDGGIRALLAGRVEKLGTTYVMSVRLIDPFRDQTVASASEEAANQESLWPAIRRLSNWTRETLGETLASIQQSNEQLEKVTTPSLRALQFYTQAMAFVNDTQWGAAEQVLRQALSEDPEFASAHILLAHTIRNQGKPEKEWGPPSQRALNLSGRISDRERYFIEASYHSIREDGAKAVSAYEALVQQYPDHFWGRNNLAWTYFSLGRYQESINQFLQAARLRPNEVWINRMAAWSVLEIDINEARRIVERIGKLIAPEMAMAHPDEVAWIQLFAVHDLWVRGEIEPALKELDRWAQTIDSRDGRERDAFARCIGNGYLAFGKLRAAEEVFQRLPEKDEEHNILLTEAASDAGDRAKLRKYLRNLKPNGDTVFLLARAGLADEAQKFLSKFSDSPTGRVSRKILEGEIALSRGRTMEAISLLQEAVPDVRWNSSWIFFTESVSLADALERQGDLQKAVQVLEKASQEKAIAYENSGSTGAYWLKVEWRLAQLYRKLGRSEEAEKVEADLSKMLAYADPEHPILLQLKQASTKSTH